MYWGMGRLFNKGDKGGSLMFFCGEYFNIFSSFVMDKKQLLSLESVDTCEWGTVVQWNSGHHFQILAQYRESVLIKEAVCVEQFVSQ